MGDITTTGTTRMVAELADQTWRDALGELLLEPGVIALLCTRCRETDVTKLITSCAPDVEQRVFMWLAGLGVPVIGLRPMLLEGSDWKKRRKAALGGQVAGDGRAPDWVVADADDDWRPIVVVELKGDASVNGKWGYCRTGEHGPYSNQSVCYRGSCWFADPALEGAARIWLSPWETGDPRGCVNLRDLARDPDRWAEFYAVQREALDHGWIRASIHSLADALGGVHGELLLYWVRERLSLAA